MSVDAAADFVSRSPTWRRPPGLFISTSPKPAATTPFLTVALLKLEEILPDFCESLSKLESETACSRLDTSLATATSTTVRFTAAATASLNSNSPSGSPQSTPTGRGGGFRMSPTRMMKIHSTATASPKHSPPQNVITTTVPSTTPLLRWLSSGSTPLTTTSATVGKQKNNRLHSPIAIHRKMNRHQPTPAQQELAQQPAGSALALEGEWEQFVSPLLLLAGAETIYADLKHLTSSNGNMAVFANSLKGLYQRIITNLLLVQQTLCDPFLRINEATLPVAAASNVAAPLTTAEDSSEISNSAVFRTGGGVQEPKQRKKQAAVANAKSHVDAANSLAVSLQGLTAHCTRRCQLVDLQTALFAVPHKQKDLHQAACAFAALLSTATDPGTPPPPALEDASESLRVALLQEIKAWKYSLEAAFQLERCQLFVLGGDLSVSPRDVTSNPALRKLENWQTKALLVIRVKTTTCLPSEEPSFVPKYFRSRHSNVMFSVNPFNHFVSIVSLSPFRNRFLETIVTMRKWQNCLLVKKRDSSKAATETLLHQWFYKTWTNVMALLPLYFDRVQAFAAPLYGFDTPSSLFQKQHQQSQQNVPTVQDWDATVAEFLHKQEKAGGPPTAVTMVLDAVSTGNVHVERGFRLTAAATTTDDKRHKSTAQQHQNGSSPSLQSDQPPSQGLSVEVLWPAVYLRSSVRLAEDRWLLSSYHHHHPSSAALRQSSNAMTSPRSFSSNVGGNKSTMSAGITKVLEYAPDMGSATSWPHSEWETLASLLVEASLLREASRNAVTSPDNNMMVAAVAAVDQSIRSADAALSESARVADEPVAVTYRDNPEEGSRQSFDSLRVLEESDSTLPSSAASQRFRESASVTSESQQSSNRQQSSFHVLALSDVLSLVVMVKDQEDTARWHRRRSRLSDEEVRSFLNELAYNLRVSTQFSSDRVPSPQDKKKELPQLDGAVFEDGSWKDEQVQAFLRELKDVFGLRPISPLVQDSLRTFVPRTKRSSSGSSPVGYPEGSKRSARSSFWSTRPRPPSNKVHLDDSAAAFFLGADLADVAMA